jgi:S-DNA-T family DNA segregation ATPase FtsK/SpoIIIE
MARRRATLEARSLIREAQAIVGGAVALFLAIALLSYSPEMPHHNLGGRIGHAIADAALQAIGVAAYLFPIYLALLMASLFRDGAEDLGTLRVGGAVLLVASVAALAGLLSVGTHGASGGGWLGGFLGTALGELIGGLGAFLVLIVMAVVALVLSTGVSAFDAAARIWRWSQQHARWAVEQWRWWRTGAGRARPDSRMATRRDEPIRLLAEDVIDVAPVREGRLPPIIREPDKKPPAGRRERGKKHDGQEELFGRDRYRLPPVSLLDEPKRRDEPIDEGALLASSRILETKLGDFGVAGRVVAVRPGPVITTFEFEPAPGVKVSRVVGLADDLAMALRAASVRILAPIPGKPVVGIEVSNPRREVVFIRELIEADAYRAAEFHLPLALGKDTTGNAVASDLGRMPHLLIAGATGTGKSVSMNAMILSLLFKSSPRDVRMIMIDPKMLELSTYENIPHLLVPVVTDPRKAAAALSNMLREMDERYQLMHAKGVRNVDSYNRAIAQASAAATATGTADPEEAAAEGDEDLEIIEAAPPPRGSLNHRHLPRIVVIIDELADLMMTVGREIEESITRLAQKARAAGIHLILATQRPSVDVITGLIKANFPARLSFQVTSRTDSRTILDAIGAERLLGQGDMLFLPPGTARVVRLHGAFVSDEEVHRVVDFIKRQEQPQYDMAFLEEESEDEAEGEEGEDLSDEMYDMAVRLVTEHRQASISWLQRRLRVGYNRAARMIERMEREGVVSAPMGARGREVIVRSLEE